MKKIKVGWSGNNYSCVIEDINGIIVVTHETLEGIKKEIKVSLDFHIEGLVEHGDDIPSFIVNGEYELDFELQIPAIRKQLDGIVTRLALSKATKINKRQLGHYIQGKREAREGIRIRVVETIKKISADLLSVV